MHDLRVAMRRIRSLLATFRPVFDTSVTEPLRVELKAASGRLGQSRDAEVATEITDHLLEDVELARLEEDAVVGLRARLRLDAAAAGDAVDETLDSTSYAALTILLDELVTHPPLTDVALRDARTVARNRVRHEARRFARLAAAARDDADGDVRSSRTTGHRRTTPSTMPPGSTRCARRPSGCAMPPRPRARSRTSGCVGSSSWPSRCSWRSATTTTPS